MSYYKYDKKQLDEIKEINEKISKEQQQIFDILLKISRSFSDDKFTKEKRNELFSQVDVLKQNIKDYNEKLKQVKLDKKECKIEKNVKNEISEEDIKQIEKKNNEFVNTAQKLEDSLKESENIKEKTEKVNLDFDINSKNSEKKQKVEETFSKRKKARTQLVVVEDDDSLSGKIKDFFSKLRNIIKK